MVFTATEKEYLRVGMAEAVNRAGGDYILKVPNKKKVIVQSVGYNFVLRLTVQQFQKTINLTFALEDPNTLHFKVPSVKLICTYTSGTQLTFSF